ncbi:hypothetical protein NQ317_005009 [Molorchus minor]|uniref:Brinker DNA-binding domain-containing protein n=1 Tax=Molorchus minor TaxID=1323400 RepID=A0ABQ9K4D8_9CUCU|nr:hypothetical protein NQ317_005009 [Molorchus minor]
MSEPLRRCRHQRRTVRFGAVQSAAVEDPGRCTCFFDIPAESLPMAATVFPEAAVMAHGLNSVLKRGVASASCKTEGKGIGSRRIFAPHFKLQVLDSYRNDADCKGNQRATARKYGIHRRQIQKWLQVENTLRNTVSAKERSLADPEARKCDIEVTLNVCRQRDDSVEARVPAPTSHSPSWPPAAAPLPLDYTTHCRGGHGSSSSIVSLSPPLPAVDPSAPMDLSLKRTAAAMADAPVVRLPLAPLSPPLAAASPSLVAPQPDVWDLSTKRKRRPSPTRTMSPKPVKLFKPYLDDLKDTQPPDNDTPPSIVKIESVTPCCSTNCESYYYNNNNNNVGDFKSEYSDYGAYTIQELQPRTTLNYYYAYPNYPDYEIGSYCRVYEDISYGQNVAPLKQRQSYSLDFKLSAIDCYYQDSVCKGNQRAVASKYNVHRRQVQKWLKQAEELKMRNETVKQTHAVR